MERIVAITGGSRGIGFATAKLFAERGDRVYILDLKAPLENAGIEYIKCDVSDFESVQSAIDKIKKQVGRIDCLFVNAGIHISASLEETTLEQFEKVLSVNFKGAFHTLKCVLPIMQSQKQGSIVLTGSDQSLIGKKQSFIYGATKGAIGQMTKSLALDCAPFNIRVNCVCPGAIKTDLYDGAVQNAADKYFGGDIKPVEDGVKQKHPLGRVGTPEEVAKLVYFLCSDDAGFMTGGLIPVDGGYTCQ
jgi:NAD(P)-dependent dehydrogenase (short-subunit alcohol dehydrogenase family)